MFCGTSGLMAFLFMLIARPLGISSALQRNLRFEDLKKGYLARLIDFGAWVVGQPLVWTYAGTETGILAGYPGVWEYPDDYDPRVRYWYKAALASETPVWTVVEADEGGMGLLLSGTVRLLDPQGEIVGVAGVDLTFAHVIDTLLEPDGGLPDGVEVWLIDKDGNAIVYSF